MKGNKGITLIALIVTIIVLIILAGVAIAMLSGDSGILNRATEARYETIISSFDEQVKLAAVNVKASITSKMVSASSTTGYIATTGTTAANGGNFRNLVEEVATDLGVAKSAIGTDNNEGFAVYSALTASDGTSEGIGYIMITYTDNSLRASLPQTKATENTNKPNFNGVDYQTVVTATGSNSFTVNNAVLVYVIKVTNYGSELSNAILTDKKTVGEVKLLTTTTVTGTPADTSFDNTTKNALRTSLGF